MSSAQKKIIVVWNPDSGINQTENQIENNLKKLEKQYQLYRVTVEEILDIEALKERVPVASCTDILAIGGDGTVNAAASVAYACRLRLVVIPDGTFNHFAKHLNLPLDSNEAFELIDSGESVFVDLGEVNNRTFVNFISVGYYADVIKSRSQLQMQGGYKWTSFLKALFRETVRKNRLRVHFKTEQGVEIIKKTPLLFVANGKFSFGSADILADRDSFTSGSLHVLMFKNYDRIRLFFIALLSMIFDTSKWSVVESYQFENFHVSVEKERIKLVIDGEVIEMNSDLVIKNNPRAIKVIVSKEQSAK